MCMGIVFRSVRRPPSFLLLPADFVFDGTRVVFMSGLTFLASMLLLKFSHSLPAFGESRYLYLSCYKLIVFTLFLYCEQWLHTSSMPYLK